MANANAALNPHAALLRAARPHPTNSRHSAAAGPRGTAHRPRHVGALLAWIGAALLAGGCSQQAAAPVAPPTVLTAVPAAAPAGAAAQYSGDVQARFASALAFRIDGKIVARLAHLGERVRQGQPLARLDPGDAAMRAQGTRAALAAAEQRLALARQQQERNRAQLHDDLVSRADFEQSEANLNVAAADLEQRRSELSLSQDQLQYTELAADHDGYITSENAEVGTVVKAGQQVFGLAWSGERDVVIDVPESRIRELARGQSASVVLLAAPIAVPSAAASPAAAAGLTAHVRDIAEAADPQSRTFRVKLALDKPEQARLGSSAQVSLLAAAGAAPGAPPASTRIAIPASALFHDGAAPAVWLVEPAEHKLSLRAVQVAQYGTDTVTLASGLSSGERIVVQGVHAVHAGEVVTPIEARVEGARP